MNSLLSDRFLKKFVGEFRHKLKHPASNTGEQKPDSEDEMVPGPDKKNAEENYEKEAVDDQNTGQDTTEDQSDLERRYMRDKGLFPLYW